VHTLQDAQSKIALIDAGLSSRQEDRDKMPGVPIEELDEQRAEDQAYEPELKLSTASRDLKDVPQ
jgi:hypothetical protein